MSDLTHEEMIEIAKQREETNQVIIAKISDEDLKKVQEAQQQYKGEQQ
jgi:hypothetical protein